MVQLERALIVVLAFGTCVFQQPLSFADDARSELTRIRVVVQDCRPGYLETSDDGRIIVGRGAEYGYWHTFYAVDVKMQQTLLNLNLPQKIIDIAIAPDNEWFVVAGQRTIYRVEMSTGDYEVLLDNVSGHVVLNAAGDRLGILGAIDDEFTERRSIHFAADLGIYDLKSKRLLARCKTPILADQELWFEEDVLVAYGLGGRVHSRLAFGGFRCDVRLNPREKEPVISAGREVWRADHEGDGYRPPRTLAARREIHEASKEILNSIKGELSPDWTGNAQYIFLPFLVGDHKPVRQPVIKDQRAMGGVLNIKSDGAVSVIHFDTSSSLGIDVIDDRVLNTVYADTRYDEVVVEDVFSEETVLRFPYRKRFNEISTYDYWMLVLSHGYLVHQPNKLLYYDLSNAQAVWEKPFDKHTRKPYPYGTSRDGKFIFFGGGDTGPIAFVRSAKSGEVVYEVPRLNGRDGKGAVCCLNDDGCEVACIFDGRLRIHSVPSGTTIHDEKLPPVKEAFFRYLAATGDKWIVGSEFAGSMILDLKEGTSVKTSLKEAFRASPVRARDRDCLLIETQPGKAGIVDINDGQVYAEWYVGKDQGGGSMPEGSPRAFAAFEGRLLVRQTARGMNLELIDLNTLIPIVEIHLVPVEGEVGWIATTGDGFWDASPGADRYVELFAGKSNLADEKDSRRKPNLIRHRIARVIAK